LGRDEPVPDFLVSNGSLGQILVTGELDCATTSQIDAAFAGMSGEVVVDCRDVTFIDSAGFHALDRGYEAATKRGATFVVTGLSRFQTRIATFLEVPYVLSSTDRERTPELAKTPVSRTTVSETERSL
jgi:anti-anti-sigma factor